MRNKREFELDIDLVVVKLIVQVHISKQNGDIRSLGCELVKLIPKPFPTLLAC